MRTRTSAFALFGLLAAAAALGADPPADRDGDGISDSHEKILGTDPARPEKLRVVIEDGLESESRRKQAGYDATKDVLRVALCHVGGDRYLWRVDLAAEPRPADTVLHLYVDADAEAKTGRKGSPGAAYVGTEYMLSVVAGRGSSSLYGAGGNRTAGPPVTFAAAGRSVWITADAKLGRDGRGVRCGLYVLCHTTTKPGGQARMNDSSRQLTVTGVPLSDRPKIIRPSDYRKSHRVSETFDLAAIRRVLRQPDVVAVPHDKLDCDGFSVDLFTSRRWPHVRRDRADGKVHTRAPKAGRYHVGFMMYDDGSDQRVSLHVEGTLAGVAVAGRGTRRTGLWWLSEPRTFRGGERVELRGLGGGGRHGICNILFLPKPPPPGELACRVQHTTAVADPQTPGRLIVSWTTTWPSTTRFEYGRDRNYGTRVDPPSRAMGQRCLVHRVVLGGLKAGPAYHGRAIVVTDEADVVYGPDIEFRAVAPPPPLTRETRRVVPLTVRNPHAFAVAAWPITTGVPIPQGELSTGDHVRMIGAEAEIASQVAVTARWPDASVKWLLVTFLADAPAKGETNYRLEYGRAVRRAPVPEPADAADGLKGYAVDVGAVQFGIGRDGGIVGVRSGEKALLSAGRACETVGVDSADRQFTPADRAAEVTVEASGPVRAVVNIVSHLVDVKGAKRLRIEKRIEAYRGLPMVRIHHTFVVLGAEEFTDLKALSLGVPLSVGAQPWRIRLEDGTTRRSEWPNAAIGQPLDNEFFIHAKDEVEEAEGRVRGSIVSGDANGLAVAVRDFWQNYPKAFLMRRQHLDIGLCPPMVLDGRHDKFPFEKEGHHLYYYLRNKVYRLKRGMSKTHEIMLYFGEPKKREQACALFQRPLLATAPAEWYCSSKAFYDVAPRDEERFPLYEAAIDRNVKAYAAARERMRDYGMLNYGDWYPERRANWGNVEYDTQHAFFLEYIRSGNAAAFFLGAAAELHNRDVDTVHWSPDPGQVGMVYVHQMGHVGGYYKKAPPGTLGFPRAGGSIGHAWCEGHFDHYFLTGDRRSYDTGRAVADYFVRKELSRPYDFSSTRVPGWHLIMNAAALAATGDPYYLNASRVIVERVLATQDVERRPLPSYQAAGRKPYQQGGWSRMMVPGHCHCEPRHRGNAGFMIAVLLSGLKYYHDVTGDERVKQCIIRGAYYLLDETYSDKVKGFRYTSCPKMAYRAGATPLMAEGIARAYLWTKDERFRRVLTEALPLGARGSSYGKGFSMYYRMAPRMLADLKAAGISLGGQTGSADERGKDGGRRNE